MKSFEMEKQFAKLDEFERTANADLLLSLPKDLCMSRDKFIQGLMKEAKSRELKIPAPLMKSIIKAFGEQDSMAEVCKDNKGKPEANTSLRDTERMPLDVEIDDYMESEVLPHVPDAWVNETKIGLDKNTNEVGKIGYEINFNRYFYVYTPSRPLEEIKGEIIGLQTQIHGLMGKLFN